MVVKRVLAELAEASLPVDSLVAGGGAVRTTIDAKAQTVAAAVFGRLCNGNACVLGVSPWMVGYPSQLAVAVYVEKAGAGDADLPRVIWQEFLAEVAG